MFVVRCALIMILNDRVVNCISNERFNNYYSSNSITSC